MRTSERPRVLAALGEQRGFCVMLTASRFALKEWAVVARALARGQQVILLRKGGIRDEGGIFRLEHPEFFLYPTFEHQNRKFLRREFLADFDEALREQPLGENLTLSVYAQVTGVLMAKGLDAFRQLKPFHVWNDEFLEMRFSYKPELPLWVLIVRAYQVDPHSIAVRPEYAGCKSWVQLEQEVPVTGARPALPDADFAGADAAIRSRCSPPESPTSPLHSA